MTGTLSRHHEYRLMDDIINLYLNALLPLKWKSCQQRTPGAESCIDCFRRQYRDGNVISYRCEEKESSMYFATCRCTVKKTAQPWNSCPRRALTIG